MNDQDQLREDMLALAQAEDLQRVEEKEIQVQAVLHIQGQIAGLVHVLRSNGILSPADVKIWERESEQASESLRNIINCNTSRAKAQTMEDVFNSTKAALLSARTVAQMMGSDVEPLDQQLAELEMQWVAHKKEGK
jgi:hypothetical protein